MSTKLFVNFSSTEFQHAWDGKGYTFPPASKTLLDNALADHFASHLVDRELIAMGKQVSDVRRVELLAKALPSGEPDLVPEAPKEPDEAESPANGQETAKEEPKDAKKARFCDKCESKGHFHKAGCPNKKSSKKKAEDEFEGVNK